MGRRVCLVLLVAMLATTFAVAACAQDEKVELKLNLKAGQKFNIRMTAGNDGRATVGKTAVDTSESLVMGMIISVESVGEDGVANVKVAFDRPNYSFSSTADPAGQLSVISSQAFTAISGKSFNISLARDGKVVAITGLSSVVSSALQSLSGTSQAVQSVASMVLNQVFSDATWRQAMAGVFSVLPPGPVAIGERWSRDMAGNADDKTYCKILSRAEGIAKIKVFTEIKSLRKQPTPGVQLSVSGTSDGVIEIEEATGLVMTGRETSKLTGKAVTPDGKSSPVTVNGTSRIERY